MRRVLSALLAAAGWIAVGIFAQVPSQTVDAQLSLQPSSTPPPSPMPELPFKQLATPLPKKASGVQNPKELSAPVKLAYADIIMDGGSYCGKLRGANGKEFWFFRGAGMFEQDTLRGLYVGYVDGHIPESARARFDGWTEADFCLLLEQAIRQQFRWDSPSQRLVPKDPQAFDDPSQMESFGGSAAKRLLRYAERVLKREESYMEEAK